MEFKRYENEDYDAVCDFLIALNETDRSHIHWNWARFEWMAEHPDFDKSLIGSIGLWLDEGRIVGAAIYDMYFGEAFCGVLPEYFELYPGVLAYAWQELRDENGLGICICEDSAVEIEEALKQGFRPAEATETLLRLELDDLPAPEVPEGCRIRELDPGEELEAFQWLLWQGFNHGDDRAEFERQDPVEANRRKHFDPSLSLTAVDEKGELLSYCCLWYQSGTDYAYVEPVCTVPSARRRGLAGALIREACRRANALGAKTAYVISDKDFYRSLGFHFDRRCRFYWKK